MNNTQKNKQSVSHSISSLNMVGGWQVWDDVLLRSAGFPAHLMTALSWEHTPQLVTEYQNQVQKLQKSLLECSAPELKKWRDKIRQELTQGSFNFLREKQLPEAVEQKVALFAVYMKNAQEDFQKQHAKLVEGLRKTASDKLFLEAVTWQNLTAVKAGIEPFIRQSGEGYNKSVRRKAHLVANYLQRFCLKNDTIGFFGPFNWAKMDAVKKDSRLIVGKKLIKERKQFFEYWSVYELAQALIRDISVRKHLKPRLSPMARFEDGVLYGPYGKAIKLPEAWVRLLAHCDGIQTADEIARISDFKDENEALTILGQLANNGPVIWQFDVPVYLRSQERLWQGINSISNSQVREKCAAHLNRLEGHLEEIGTAAGDHKRLGQELERMDQSFTEITGKSATHEEGHLYAGRTVMFEDSVRDVELTLGTDFQQSCEEVLNLIMISGRWFTWQISQQLSEFFTAVFDELTEDKKLEALPLDVFLAVFKKNRTIVEEIIKDVRSQLQEKWWGILPCEEGGRAFRFSSSDIIDKVKDTFDAPMPGWVGARYYSPDLMIKATSLDEVNKGNCEIIVGEFHMALNPFLAPSINDFHPDAKQIIDRVEEELKIARIMPVPEGHTIGHRTIQDRFADNILHILINDTASILPGEKTIAISELQVVNQEGRLIIKSRDEKLHFDLIGQADFLFKGMVAGNFQCLHRSGYMPRITIDNVILSREEWCFTASELSFSYIKDKPHQFIRANIWREENNLPQYVFLKTPLEGKPVFVDFYNPVSVATLCKYSRQVEKKDKNLEIHLSEMLPGPDDLWLKDKDGHGYTSELRFVMVDPVEWKPA